MLTTSRSGRARRRRPTPSPPRRRAAPRAATAGRRRAAPAASTVRRIAPTLCGSSMPSSTTISGGVRRGRRDEIRDAVVARAARARRRRPGARRRARRARAIARRRRPARTRHATSSRVAPASAHASALRPRLVSAVDAVDRAIRDVTRTRRRKRLAATGLMPRRSAPWTAVDSVPERLRERLRALAAADDRRQPRVSPAARAAIDRRHRQIQLGPAVRPGQRDAESDGTAPCPSARSARAPGRRPPGTPPCRRAAPRSRRAAPGPRSRAPRCSSTCATSGCCSAAAGSKSNRNCSRSGISSSRSTEPTAIGSSDARNSSASSVAAPHVAARHEVADRLGGDPARRRHLHVVAVHPRQLLVVEDAGAVADVLDREAARELRHRQQLVVGAGIVGRGARRPADQRQVVDQRLGQIPAQPELRDRGRAVPLRQRRVIGSHHQRQMRELRRRESERPIEQQLPRRVRDVILAADHMRHLHQRIVDDDGEVVGGRPSERTRTGSPMTSVLNVTSPRTSIGERRPRSPGARGSGSTGRSPASIRARASLEREVPAGPVILRRPARRQIRLALAFELAPASRSSSRRGRRRAARWRTTRTGAAAPTGGTGRAGRRCPAPRPSPGRASADPRECPLSDSRVDRSASVSSMRRMNVPSWPRASSQLNSAVRALPTCS